MYKVIKFFTDLKDRNYPYHVGDRYPREGVTVSKKRIEELAGYNNRQHRPLIQEVPDEEEKKPWKPGGRGKGGRKKSTEEEN